ncbi:hypothetical protein ABZ705_00980 [Streptomyces sp. NPDC006984]|uniref:hypothetical protein n=1 Tax=Streptomyces sp. NPDC006984 TaxID=3155463 RepID=UPI0033C0B56E
MSSNRAPLDVARAAIPGFLDVQAADTALRARITELDATTAPADLVTEAFTALTTGQPLPDGIGRRAWEAEQTTEFRSAELAILNGVQRRLNNHGENLVKKGADHGLRALRPFLDDLVNEARPMVAALRGVHSAQNAIDRGPDTIAAWSSIADIVTRYATIRRAQHTITRVACGQDIKTSFGHLGFNQVFRVWSEIENVTEVWPDWAPGERSEAPWPVVYRGRPFEVNHDREWVMWLLSNPTVRLWVPTVGELTQAYEAQRKDATARATDRAKGETPRVEGSRKRPVRQDPDDYPVVAYEEVPDSAA